MILIAAILAGLAVGYLLSRWQKRTWTAPSLRALWLVIIAFLPQLLFFYFPATRSGIPDGWVAAGLISSQGILLIFCWLNRQVHGVWIMGAGLVLNLLVIVVNGGLMPISPQTASRLVSQSALQNVPVGTRFGYSKDILLLPENTHLAWLSDRFVTPGGLLHPLAFSLGDVVVSAGVFWLLMFQGIPWRGRTNKEPNP